MAMIYLKDIMSTQVTTVFPETPLNTAFNLMLVHQFHHLIVLENERVVGLLSIRDLDMVGDEHAREGLQVGAAMITNMVTAAPDTTLQEAAELMRGSHLGCLPVLDKNGALAGLVTTSDILSLLAKTAQQLQLVSG